MKTSTLKINNKVYNLNFRKWTTYNGKQTSGWSCQVDSNTNLTDPTKEGLINKIKNYKPCNDLGAREWYAKGYYMAD